MHNILNMVISLIFALLSSFCFALYSVPQKLCKPNVYTFSYFIGLGYFVCSLIMYFIQVGLGNTEPIFNLWLLVAGVAGSIWYFGQLTYMKAISNIGLSRASTWQKMQGPIASLSILFLFNEYNAENLVFIILSIVLMGVSALFFAVEDGKSDRKKSVAGLLLALGSAFIFASNVVVRKYLTAEGLLYTQQVYSSFFIMLTAFICASIKEKNCRFAIKIDKSSSYGLLTGAIYFVATFLMILAFDGLLGTVVSNLKQLSAIFTLIFGIFVFKEISFKQHYVRILLGFFCIILSIVCLCL